MSKRGPLIFLAVLLASLLPSLLRIAWPFLTSFILASILAIVINPANQWLSRRVHRPGLATFLTTFATVFLLGIIVAFAGFALAEELTTTYDGLSRRSLEEGGWPALVTHTADRVVDALATRLPLNADAIRTEAPRRHEDCYRLPAKQCRRRGWWRDIRFDHGAANNNLSLLPAPAWRRLDQPAGRSDSARSACHAPASFRQCMTRLWRT